MKIRYVYHREPLDIKETLYAIGALAFVAIVSYACYMIFTHITLAILAGADLIAFAIFASKR